MFSSHFVTLSSCYLFTSLLARKYHFITSFNEVNFLSCLQLIRCRPAKLGSLKFDFSSWKDTHHLSHIKYNRLFWVFIFLDLIKVITKSTWFLTLETATFESWVCQFQARIEKRMPNTLIHTHLPNCNWLINTTSVCLLWSLNKA